MRAFRLVLLVPAIAAMLLASGCQIRGGSEKGPSAQELRAENGRLSAEVQSLTAENETLKRQRDEARELLSAAQNSGPKVGGLLDDGAIDGVEIIDGGVALDEDFLFAKGSSELGDAGKRTIQTLAERLNKGDFAGSKVVVEGHTDDTPVAKKSNVDRYGNNWGLSAMRSAMVITELQKAGVSADRLRGAFRGEYSPRGSDKARNRRVELFVR
ncbi:MAG: OmpA family protein [Planctomycetes bacterium]|nr:OmpA family protein [Planctomycetota bacterium]